MDQIIRDCRYCDGQGVIADGPDAEAAADHNGSAVRAGALDHNLSTTRLYALSVMALDAKGKKKSLDKTRPDVIRPI